MTIDDKIKGEKLQYDINKQAAKMLTLSRLKQTNTSVLQVKKHYLLIKNKEQNKLNLQIHHFERLLQNQANKRKKNEYQGSKQVKAI